MTFAPFNSVFSEKNEFILSHLPRHLPALEISKSTGPIVDKDRFEAFHVDYAMGEDSATSDLIMNRTSRCDAVWHFGKPLSRCIGDRSFGYAVVSNVLEKVPNPLGWLQEILECLEENGRIAILFPLRTRSKDFYRRDTTFAEIVGWSIEKPARPTPIQVMDALCQSFEDDGTLDFDAPLAFSATKRHYSDAKSLEFAEFVGKSDHFLDIQVSTWTPENFSEIFSRLANCKLLNVDVIGAFSGFPGASPSEFVGYLQKRHYPI